MEEIFNIYHEYSTPEGGEPESRTLWLSSEFAGVSINLDAVDYDLECPYQCVSILLNDEEVDQLAKFLNNYIKNSKENL